MANYTEGRLAILAAPGGPTSRQLDSWVEQGFLKPVVVGHFGNRRVFVWSKEEQYVAVLTSRLYTAGLRIREAVVLARLIYAKKPTAVHRAIVSDHVTIVVSTDRIDL